MYGEPWLVDAYKNIMLDYTENLRFQMMLMPIARTPMSKSGGSAMDRYYKKVNRTIDKLVPWTRRKRTAKYAGRLEPGKLQVHVDGKDSRDNYMYKDADFI